MKKTQAISHHRELVQFHLILAKGVIFHLFSNSASLAPLRRVRVNN